MKLNRLIGIVCALALVVSARGQGVSEEEFQKKVYAAVATYRDGNTDEAIKAFEALFTQNPRSSDVQAWLGFLYLRTGKADQAVSFLERALNQRPTDIEILNNLGNAYLATGKLDLALAKYQTIIQKNPKLFEPYYNSGTIYLRKRDWTRALDAFLQAEKLSPKDAFVQNNLGVAHEALGNEAKAAETFKKASDLRPDNKTFARNAGVVLAKLRKPEALTYLQRAYDEAADPALTLAYADALTRAGKTDEALKLFESLREHEARNVGFWFNLGVLRAKKGDEAGAEQAYRKALELNNSDLDALNNLGLLLFKQGKVEEAYTLFDKLAGLNPSSINAKMNLAAAAAATGRLPSAIEAWKAVIRAEPSRVGVRLDLANALLDSGDLAGARYHYNQVLLMSRNNAEALNGMGLCHLREAKLAQAEAAFRSATEADPKYLPAYANLALTMERAGRRAEAIKVLEKAATVDPADEEIRRNLNRLRTGG